MMKIISNWKQLFLLTFTAILAVFLFLPNSAEASVRKTEEADGQILYQSRHQLQDNQQQSWQVVLFKREKGETETDVKLRLVGFPGKVEVTHPEPLVIETDRAAWQAEDLFAEKSPAPNVGQYNLNNIIPELSPQDSLVLKIPANDYKNLTLKVPGVIILEWKIVAGNNES
ncbi:hypothetical protein PCC7418_0804 [Halothece sp. PCC 7418]|uniref:DUF3122 domain-containing protein n=1 Tax=Halothece sp. (strain PCC 7418) TaxID=65093 RepID=UPI0002A0758C|nr:DUF3122 domain-containing protein [Halothece sp. PCC 7418]AFZ43019.1 hypothetical protein PCC7418_0804 [Halothece sp. PCC 7418]